ncbi:flagellar protein FlaG [Tepidibacillus fermentans]|uniref:Flagellar protein FlaG n=1 Tax=Tepidibacillus fermentans TaxID=1281767 RepID=A0A4R3KIC4_9BACI|nr:flagellar protein FlaG [Tepidibacillus fermentans]TCS83306.1 flagellar protein FlaG [Tepidibacillus fermentans]
MGIEGVLNTKQIRPIERVQENTFIPDKKLLKGNKEEAKIEETPNTISKEQLEKEIESVNQFLKSSQTSIKFQLHDKLHEYYVQIIDENTKEVIKEIPPKKFLDMYANIMEQIGLIVDHRI